MIKDAKLATNFGHADDKLSRAATRLRDIRRQQDFSHMEMREMGAPSECSKLINGSSERDRQDLYREMGTDEDGLYTMFVQRTTSRWLFYNL